MADLDVDLISGLLVEARRRSPRAFDKLDQTDALIRLGAAARCADGEVRPTLAGLLSLGAYPQQFVPQLFVSFVVLPGTRMGQAAPAPRSRPRERCTRLFGQRRRTATATTNSKA